MDWFLKATLKHCTLSKAERIKFRWQFEPVIETGNNRPEYSGRGCLEENTLKKPAKNLMKGKHIKSHPVR